MHLVLDNVSQEESNEELDAKLSANLSLTLPGSVLYMSALSILKRFRNCGNKSGGIRGWRKLQAEELGELKEKRAVRGTDKVCRS